MQSHVSHYSLNYSLWRRRGGGETSSQLHKRPYSVIMFVGENRLDWLYAFTIMSRQCIITLQSHQNLDINHNSFCLQNFWSATLCIVVRGCGMKWCERQTGGWYRATAVAALSLGIHRGFFRRAALVGLARGQTALINGAGAVRQTDRQADTQAGCGGAGQGSSVRAEDCFLQQEAPDSPPADWCGFISMGCGFSDLQ